MTNVPSFGIILMFFFMFMLFIPDVSMYFIQYQTASNLANTLVEKGGKNGQIDQTLIDDELAEYHLSSSNWHITATSGQVDYNQPIKVEVEGTYKMRAMYAIGQAFGDENISNLPIKVSREMNSQVFLRQ